MKENENPRDAAVRECFEETGIRCLDLKPLINFHPDFEYTKNYTHIFYTEDVEDIPNDNSRYVWISLQDCLSMIFAEKIADCLSIISILAYWTKVKNKGGFCV